MVLETRLHNNNKYGCPQGPLCASLLNQMNQRLELSENLSGGRL